jgi:cytochrome b
VNLPIALRVWDGPTRIFHWLLVALFVFTWWSSKTDHMDWHKASGLAILTLLAFRLLWGMFGSSTARFARFLRGPGTIAAYLRGQSPPLPGHNPLGGWSVIALLGLLFVQVGTGLLAVDVDGIESGPLSYLVTFDQGRLAAQLHSLAFNLLLVLIALHVLAILFYLVARKRNLVRPMVTGRDTAFPEGTDGLVPGKWWLLLVAVAAAFLFTWWIANGARH